MRMKGFVFLSVFLFVLFAFVMPSLSAVNTDSGSDSMSPPTVKFKEWQIGRSEQKGTNKDNTVHTSFITSTEKICWFTASVGYDGEQPENTAPINPETVLWDVIDASHDMDLDETSKTKSWSRSHPSKLSGTTSFNVVAKLTVPQHQGTNKTHCPNYDGTNTPL